LGVMFVNFFFSKESLRSIIRNECQLYLEQLSSDYFSLWNPFN